MRSSKLKTQTSSKEWQVLGIDSESEETQEAKSEVLAIHSTDGQKKSLIGKVGNDYPKDPL